MRLLAGIIAAAAASATVANPISGPCTMKQETAEGNYCSASFLACISSVSLAPSNSSAVQVTMSGGSSCYSGTPGAEVIGNEAGIDIETPFGVLTLNGSPDIPRGFSGFQLRNASNAAQSCFGGMAVTSGSCLFSEQGRLPPTPQESGPCSIKPFTSFGSCQNALSCMNPVSLSPAPISSVSIQYNSSASATCSTQQAFFETEENETVSVGGEFGNDKVVVIGEKGELEQGMVRFGVTDNSGDNVKCAGYAEVSQGTCLFSEEKPKPTTDPVLTGPCSFGLQSATDACPADLKTCLAEVGLSMRPGGGAQIAMSGGSPCYNGRVPTLTSNGVAALGVLFSFGEGFLYGGQAEPQGQVRFVIDLDPLADGNSTESNPSNGTWNPPLSKYPCQAVLSVSSGICLHSNEGPLPSTDDDQGNTDDPVTVPSTTASPSPSPSATSSMSPTTSSTSAVTPSITTSPAGAASAVTGAPAMALLLAAVAGVLFL